MIVVCDTTALRQGDEGAACMVCRAPRARRGASGACLLEHGVGERDAQRGVVPRQPRGQAGGQRRRANARARRAYETAHQVRLVGRPGQPPQLAHHLRPTGLGCTGLRRCARRPGCLPEQLAGPVGGCATGVTHQPECKLGSTPEACARPLPCMAQHHMSIWMMYRNEQ